MPKKNKRKEEKGKEEKQKQDEGIKPSPFFF